jgi:hypothetical protein
MKIMKIALLNIYQLELHVQYMYIWTSLSPRLTTSTRAWLDYEPDFRGKKDALG